VKISSSYISSPLTKLCNRILSTGVFPDYLKYSEILPLFKSGSKDKIDSYRPISLLLSFSKIFEKLILHRLISHFNNHNILANEQFGFRQNYSTDKAIFKLLNHILNALNNKKTVGGKF
jgi:Notch-like protein